MPYQPVNKTKPVAYLTGDGNYTTLHYTDGTTALSSRTLKDVMTWQPGLLRISKSVAINPAFVSAHTPHNSRSLTVELKVNGQVIRFETSRRKVTPTEHALLDFKANNSLPS